VCGPRASARELGFPLVTKPLWDCLANGVGFLDGPAALSGYLHTPFNGDTVLERCLRGELCSVELVGRGDEFVVRPLVWKGRTGGKPEFTLRHVAPRPAAEAGFAPVADVLRSLCAGIGIEGNIEVEMIYTEGRYQIIEINPRVSGSTTLPIVASGCNTYACLLDLALGHWSRTRAESRTRSPRRLAFQFPLAPTAPPAIEAMCQELDLVRATTLHIDDEEYGNAIISYTPENAPTLGTTLRALHTGFALIPATVVEDIETVVGRASDALREPLGATAV
jgi:hypothetical protein